MGINTNKEFDQIFREKLHDHEVMPPESIWVGIEASGLHATAAKSSNWRWWAAASVLALFLTASGYLYFNGEDTKSVNEDQNISQQDQNLENIPQVDTEITNNDEAIVIEETQIENPEVSNLTNSVKEELEQEDIEFVEQMIFEEEVLNEENILLVEQEEIIEEVRIDAPEKVNALDNKNLNEDAITYQDIDKPTENTQATKAGKDFFDDDAIDAMTSGHLHDKYWELGIEFSPEWITIPDNSDNIQSYGLDLSAKYYFSKLFIETGLGIAFSKDNGDYDVDYQEAFFKGSYEDVYDITFEIVDGQEVPTYYTKTVNIFDTVDRVSISENKNKYAYLNIPIRFGYSTKLGDKFSFYTKLGLNASFKIYEDIPVPVVTGENVTIIKITPRYYQRTDWYMQAQINVGVNYHITDKFLFGLEPNASYYLKSLVEDNSGGNPYGLGVKIGFKYILK